MTICFSDKQKGILGISGHAGVGHVHSHSGFVQDDSAGLAVAALILKKALPTRLARIQAMQQIQQKQQKPSKIMVQLQPQDPSRL